MANFNKSKRNGRQKRGKDRFNTKADKMDTTNNKHLHATNDVSWYSSNPQLLEDAASISFNNPAGIRLGINNDAKYNIPKYQNTFHGAADYVPGVLSINVLIGPGLSRSASSAVNVASRNIYSYVRHANSGSANYTAPDLMQYLIAMDSAYSFYNFMKRLYGVMNVYSTQNRYVPGVLVNSMGFDPIEIQSRLADLRYYLNNFCLKLNSFYVPNTMPVMVRHSWLFSNVYSDSDTGKAQMYIFNPDGFYRWNEKAESEQLEFKELTIKSGRYRTLDSLFEYGNMLIEALTNSESIGIMSGDIKKAYGDNLVNVSPITADYTVVPVYNVEVLTQIENSFAIGDHSAISLNWRDLGITSDPDTNQLLYDPKYVGSGYTNICHMCNPIVNMHSTTVSPADVMVATRLRPIVADESYDTDTDTTSILLDAAGTEIVTHYTMWTFGEGTDGVVTYATDFNSILCAQHVADITKTINDFVLSLQISKFNYHPVMYVTSESEDGLQYFYGTLADIDNFAVSSANVFRKMHDTAVMSEFGIPYRS